MLHISSPSSQAGRLPYQRVPMAFLGMALALALSCSTAYAETQSIEIESKPGTHYSVFQLFKQDGDAKNSDAGGAVAWASKEAQEAIVAFLSLAENGSYKPYDAWLIEQGRADGKDGTVSQENRDDAGNAAEFISSALSQNPAAATTDDAGDSVESASGSSAAFAEKLCHALVESDIPNTAIASGESFEGAEGLYLFAEQSADGDEGQSVGKATLIPIGKNMAMVTEGLGTTRLSQTVRDNASITPAKHADANAGEDLAFAIETKLPQNLGSYQSFHWRVSEALDPGIELADSDTSSVIVKAGGRDITSSITGGAGTIELDNDTLVVNIPDILSIEEAGNLVAGDPVTVEFQAHVRPGAPFGALQCQASYLRSSVPMTSLEESDSVGGTATVHSFGIAVSQVNGQSQDWVEGVSFTAQVADANPATDNIGLYVQGDGTLGEAPYTFTTSADGTATVPNVDAGVYVFHEVSAPENLGPSQADFTVSLAPVYDEHGDATEKLVASCAGSGDEEDPATQKVIMSDVDSKNGLAMLTVSRQVSPSALPVVPPVGEAPLYALTAIATLGCLVSVILLIRDRRKRSEEEFSDMPSLRFESTAPHWEYW